MVWPFRNVELRERILDLLELEIAALGDFHGARRGRLGAVEDRAISSSLLTKNWLVSNFMRFVSCDRFAGLDAEHHVLRVRIVFAEVVAVVGSDHGDAEFLLQPEQIVVNALLFRRPWS